MAREVEPLVERRWLFAGAAAAAILAVALWLWPGASERDAKVEQALSELQAQDDLEAAVADDLPAPWDEGAALEPPEIAEGVHSSLDPEFESVEVDGDTASYTHSAAGFQVDFPSRFNTSVPQLTGPIQGRFFLVSRSDELFPAMLYAAALEYTPPGGDAFAEEFELLTEEELSALGEEFLSEDQVPQGVRKVNHGGVPGIELVAEDPSQQLVQVTRIFFGESHLVMVSGLVPTGRFDEQEPLVREYLDSLRWF